ncbi:MAG: hypothetical protein QM607_12420, partial [Microbacterium sp.]
MLSRWGRAAGPAHIATGVDDPNPPCSARWDELELLGPDGEIDGTISATSYVVDDGADRPVTFLWNGGPGASSSPLHARAFGPWIL